MRDLQCLHDANCSTPASPCISLPDTCNASSQKLSYLQCELSDMQYCNTPLKKPQYYLQYLQCAKLHVTCNATCNALSQKVQYLQCCLPFPCNACNACNAKPQDLACITCTPCNAKLQCETAFLQ